MSHTASCSLSISNNNNLFKMRICHCIDKKMFFFVVKMISGFSFNYMHVHIMCIAYFINLGFYDNKNIFRITMHILGFSLLITICFTWRLSHLSCHSTTFIHENINFLTRHIFFSSRH